jgi:hypothetical protein
VRGLERTFWWRRLSRGVRRIGIEKRGERVGLPPINEAGDEKLILKSFRMTRAAQECEQAAHFRIGMNDHAIAPGDRRHDQSAKRETVAIGRGINGIKQFHAQHRAFRKPIEHGGRSAALHACLELKIHDRASRHAQRGDIGGSSRIRGLTLRGERGESDGANKQRDETSHEEPLRTIKTCREFSRVRGGMPEVNREATKARRNERSATREISPRALSHSISAPANFLETLPICRTSPIPPTTIATPRAMNHRVATKEAVQAEFAGNDDRAWAR